MLEASSVAVTKGMTLDEQQLAYAVHESELATAQTVPLSSAYGQLYKAMRDMALSSGDMQTEMECVCCNRGADRTVIRCVLVMACAPFQLRCLHLCGQLSNWS